MLNFYSVDDIPLSVSRFPGLQLGIIQVLAQWEGSAHSCKMNVGIRWHKISSFAYAPPLPLPTL